MQQLSKDRNRTPVDYILLCRHRIFSRDIGINRPFVFYAVEHIESFRTPKICTVNCFAMSLTH